MKRELDVLDEHVGGVGPLGKLNALTGVLNWVIEFTASFPLVLFTPASAQPMESRSSLFDSCTTFFGRSSKRILATKSANFCVMFFIGLFPQSSFTRCMIAH